MTLTHGVITRIQAPETPELARTSTVIGIVGTGTSGSPAADVGVPVSVRKLSEATAQFGTAGTIIDACKHIYAVSNPVIVGIRYNHSLTSTGLVTAITAAIKALSNAEGVTGFRPSVILAPGLTANTSNADTANAFATLLETISVSLPAIGISDAILDFTKNADALVTEAKAWKVNNTGTRVLVMAQEIETPQVAKLPGSSFLAGAIAANDLQNGVQDSISNRVIGNIVSVTPNLTFSYTDINTQAQDLDSVDITTLVRKRGLWRAWGGQTTYASATDIRRFMGVVRISDAIDEDVERVAIGLVDRGLNDNFIDRWVQGVNEILRSRVLSGHVISAFAESDSVNNTRVNLIAGRPYINTIIEPIPGAELLTNTRSFQLPG